MNATGERLSFATKRVVCPACGSGRWFAPVIGAPGAGKCFACGEFLPPNRTPDYGNEGILRTRTGSAINLNAPATITPPDDEREVPREDVTRSLMPLIRCRKREECFDRQGVPECDDFEELAGKFEYESGLNREESEAQAARIVLGLENNINNPMTQIIHEEITLLRRENPFFATITELTRSTILSEWNVGLSSDGAVIFWYCDVKGRFRNAKKIWYDADGFHRLREGRHAPHFLYRGNSVPLYGEWQLSSGREHESVALVESEKSAMVLACHVPGFVVLATGGSESLTERRARVLRGRNVNILFDRDDAGTRGAERASRILSKIGARPKIINPFELWPDAPDGYDRADAIYDEIILGIKHGQALN
jgi:Domain of unknown function (DUF6371)/Toprim-like